MDASGRAGAVGLLLEGGTVGELRDSEFLDGGEMPVDQRVVGQRLQMFRREVPHCARFGTVTGLLAATHDFFARYHRCPDRVRSNSGAHPANVRAC
jgi:hypothetical protein